MASHHFLLLMLLLQFTLGSPITAKKHPQGAPSRDLVHASCARASYPHICFRTLSSYAGPANTPRDIAKAAVRIGLSRARRTSRFLSGIRPRSRRERNALVDCIEEMGDAVDELHRSLRELKHLRWGITFRWQINNVQTWVSAALTDDETCLDGFEEVGWRVRSDVKRRVRNVARVTSNALYLINRLDQYSRSADARISRP